ncbi:MAG: tetratricopeptide repeat protein [Candidatus Omnitrophica bacterium]|nr:tetratricopeptide repeat protein [Candidatus Omnitrophota bacterium]
MLNKQIIYKSVVGVVSSMAFFYVCAGLFFISVLNISAFEVAKLRALNRIMPSLSVLVKLDQTQEIYEGKQIDEYLLYYEKVLDYMPKNADAYYMKGYCLAKKGYLEKAAKSFQQSIDLNPQFFWAHYNLGLMYFKLNQNEEALKSFQSAVQTRPEITFKVMMASKIFQQLIAQLNNPQEILTNDLKTAYTKCYQLIIVINQLKESHQEVPAQFHNQLEIKIF